MIAVTHKVGNKTITELQPSLRVSAGSRATTFRTHVDFIDWYFPKAKRNEDPAKYVGRVAKFMREWHNMTMKQVEEKFKISHVSLWRIENGKWQSINKTARYMHKAWGLVMGVDFEERFNKK